MPWKFERLRVAGFRSLRDVSIELTPVTVISGVNGAGKSNLIAALRMISMIRGQALRRFVGERGGASSLLHYGPATTKELTLRLEVVRDRKRDSYEAALGVASGDTFAFTREVLTRRDGDGVHQIALGVGHRESLLPNSAHSANHPLPKRLNELISSMGFFDFHDASLTSPLRLSSSQADGRALRSDGGNLAAFLYRLRRSEADHDRAAWSVISGLVRRVAPFIKELMPDLESPEYPEQSAVRLYWRDERDHRFDAHDLSDGTLRAIALCTALAQPAASRPAFLILDEPELGLHPAAISVFASLVRTTSLHTQLLIATQSPALLDELRPEDVLIAERPNGESAFRRASRARALAS